MAHFPKKLARLLQKVAHLWRILGSNLALFQNFHLETLPRAESPDLSLSVGLGVPLTYTVVVHTRKYSHMPP